MESSALISTLVFLILIVVFILLFLPKRGIIAKLKKMQETNKRVQVENALKHIFDYEYHELKPTLNSIAGNLGITSDSASMIVSKLKKLSLISINDQTISLTDEGKQYALRVIRVHRLWESYLAEEIGSNELDWHEQAELIEHSMTEEEADQLSAKIGNPKFDPHGDPIPTKEGVIPHIKGITLNEVGIAQTVRIVHIEDEPKTIYSKLVDEKLFPGRVLKILEKTDKKIKVAVEGEEKIITPLLASNLNVVLVEQKEFINEKQKDLTDLKSGETGEILQILPICRGQQRRRLMDFGIVPGAKISLLMKSPLHDPIAFVVKETIVALRNEQAKQVILKNVG